ncbi:MAG: lipid II flippase MurJ [Patescibacteria group bacterium]
MAFTRFFRIDPKGVHQAALLLAMSSIANGALGLLRDRLLAGEFGASRALDIYYAAFRIPDFIFSLSLFFVASTAFIPLLIEHKNRSVREAQDFFDTVFTFFIMTISGMIIVAYFVMPYLIPKIVPGFGIQAQLRTIMLARVMLLSPLLLGASSLVSSIVQSSRKFFTYALAPIAYNGGIIIGILYLVPRFGFLGLAYGVTLGALFHLLVQVPTLLKLGALPRFRFIMRTNPFQVMYYSLPRASALSVNQLTLLVLTSLASTLGAGAIAIFNLSTNLYALPIAIIGLSYSVASFPIMAELALHKDKNLFFEHLLTATRHILFWTMPVTGLVIVLRAHIVRLILGTGSFAWIDTHLTTASLLIFSFAIVSQSLVTLFVRAYHALGRVREPMIFNITAAITTMSLAYGIVFLVQKYYTIELFFTWLFRIHVENLPNIIFLSLPFAFSVGTFINALLLGVTIFRLNGSGAIRELITSAMRIFCITIVVSFAAYGVLKIESAIFTDDSFFSLSTFVGVLLQGGGAGLVGLLIGGALSWFFDIREFQEIKQALSSRFNRKDLLGPDIEHI